MVASNRTIYAASELLGYLDWPLLSLSIDAKKEKSEQLPIDRDKYLSIIFARSQQGQCAIWPPAQHSHFRGRLVTQLASAISADESQRFLEIAQGEIAKISWRGSGMVRISMEGKLIDVTRGAQREAIWTLDHSLTSVFENEVRAVFDLPLGDISLRSSEWMTMEFAAPQELDMFHPYLHLCARNPRYKFHHFDTHHGVISLSGNSEKLAEDLEHAVDYLEGVINE